MIYHPEEHKIAKIVKLLAFWASLFAMAWMFVAIIRADVKIPQQKLSVNINISDRVNICLPEGDDLFEEETFFRF